MPVEYTHLCLYFFIEYKASAPEASENHTSQKGRENCLRVILPTVDKNKILIAVGAG